MFLCVIQATMIRETQIMFCLDRRQKLLRPGESLYRAVLDSVTLSDENVRFQIIHEENKVRTHLA